MALSRMIRWLIIPRDAFSVLTTAQLSEAHPVSSLQAVVYEENKHKHKHKMAE
jgi:hypothetical protein